MLVRGVRGFMEEEEEGMGGWVDGWRRIEWGVGWWDGGLWETGFCRGGRADMLMVWLGYKRGRSRRRGGG